MKVAVFKKHKIVTFKKLGRTPKEKKLELAHIDIWGSASVSSMARKSYFMTFIDNQSRNV